MDCPVGRFAPSPTGRMHAGKIFAALMSWLVVKSQNGKMVLRIEDLDVERSKQAWADQVQRDLEFLGLTWDEGPYFQQDRNEAYEEAFGLLEERAHVFPCFCTRADLHAASAPHRGEKIVYPGTCRSLTPHDVERRKGERSPAWRLAAPDVDFEFDDLVQGSFHQNLMHECGDFVIRRSDGLFAYQLAVVVDDAQQGVNCIVRGMDLLVSTPQQVYLQDVLGYPHATYAHVPLIVGERDRRLSKRDRDAALDVLIARFGTAEALIGHIAAITGLIPEEEPIACENLLESFEVERLGSVFPDKVQILWR